MEILSLTGWLIIETSDFSVGIFYSMLGSFHLTDVKVVFFLPLMHAKLSIHYGAWRLAHLSFRTSTGVERLVVSRLSFPFFIPSYFADIHTEATFPLGLYQMLEISWLMNRIYALSRFHNIQTRLSLQISFLSKSIGNKIWRKLFHTLTATFYKSSKTIFSDF